MAIEEQLRSISREASADLSALQYFLMTIDSSGQVAATADGAAADGVLQDKPDAAGQAGTLGISGVTKVVAGAAVTAGDDIASDSTGRGILATTGDVIAGKALSDASGAGFIFSMLLSQQKEPLA